MLSVYGIKQFDEASKARKAAEESGDTDMFWHYQNICNTLESMAADPELRLTVPEQEFTDWLWSGELSN